ncbi:MAG: DUF5818 domain-containing protein [Bryobacteraceae bacterium]
MNRLTIVMLAGALLLGAENRKQTFTGVVTDSMCGADHSAMGVKPDSKCVRECVKNGAKYALVVGAKVYTLSDQQTPERFAAQKVKVTGTLDSSSNIIVVDKIEPAR